MSAPVFALTFVTALGCALAAGVFYAFSSFVMAGLDRRSPATAVGAMQGINVTAVRPPLMLPLFGTAPLCLAVAVLALLDFDGARSWFALAGAAIYLIGIVGVTMLGNVPLNERIDRVDPDGPTAAEEWRRYYGPWCALNHVRTVSGLAATAGMIAALTA
ncbi:MAG TPA: anthrone oxygenase family protein [Solirubrobacterales bacterium]|nr:anthrone oxygenase family protein [Solirubrobacterales bacterium]